MTPPDSASAGRGELRKILNILFDDGRIAYANDKSPDVCQQYIDRAEAMVDAYILAEVLDIVNTGQFIAPNLTAKENVRSYQDFIVEKAIARFGKGGNRG